MQAMILAAGYGTRLLPYSKYRPKPLFPLLNIPLLHLHIELLRGTGFDHIVVNCHYLCAQIRAALQGIHDIILIEEEHILGTGGALRNAGAYFRDEPLLVTNGDIYHNIDLAKLYRQHKQGGAQVSLAVHDCPRFNGLQVEKDTVLSFDAAEVSDALAFTGIHVLDPSVLQAIGGGKSCILERYRGMLAEKSAIAAVRVDDRYWRDMGTPADYLALHGQLLVGKAPPLGRLQQRVAAPFYIDGGAELGNNLNMVEWCSIGRAKIGNNVTITRSVIWDGAAIADGSTVTDTIVV